MNRYTYAKPVKLWSSFHKKNPTGIFNKITAEFWGICLKYQLFGRVRDFFTGI